MKLTKEEIRVPIWNNGERAVGLATHKPPCLLEITYVNSKKERLYPDTYIVTKEFAAKYPVKKFTRTPPLFIIPIVDLIKEES